ncbi:hypothetical protein DL240_14845 [Lujinxingia litoralis]|uniref:Uncharacterized protein n=1 Tax=Lujinxingia litoralis TaxID=2211119 RepID=A0A328C3S5_9DELT|nr:hypothetical protein [Lujinxingia litoralis]RAL20948.1 hypothetical protein DL240_14845 [Lujinxingia litoralis]
MEKQPLYLYEAQNAAQVGPVENTGLDVYFPDHVAGWTDVLDCREEPYTERSIAENCAFALHVHKKFILVGASQIAQESPAL